MSVVNRIRIFAITLVLLMLNQAAVSAESAPRIQTWKTNNGAKVLYVYAPQLPMVDVRMVFDAGSARDGKQAGLASMTSTMLSKGAGDWDTDALAERFDSIGAEFSTSAMRDMASLSLRSLNDKKLLDKAVLTLQTVLTRPRFDNKELARMRRQTLIALKAQLQSPGAIANKMFYRALYGQHPYASPSLGTKDSIKSISRADLQAFYRRYYVASNALIAIVGDVDLGQAKQLANKLLGKLPKGQPAPALAPVKPLKKAQVLKKTYPSTQTHILVGQPGLRRGDPDYFALYVGNHILGGSGFGSRIVKEIREKRGLAYSSYSYFIPMRGLGPFQMGLQTSNDQRDEALALLNKILRNFIKHGPTHEEMQQAIKNITGGFPLRIDSNKDIIGYIAMIGFYDLPLNYLETFNTHVEAVTVAKVQDAFRRRIHPDKLVTVMVGGNAPQKSDK
ncbi:FIG015287: Zinc protease [hydrothermal vent metagenome]|uniref:FIG015287: Zinc protease n=1 Tax=hydrothermal vent metagenome TaxID=652676 RepID=A0A3B1B7R2_9ZZZZ